jgi:Tfp pilus assembly protein PilO
MVLLGSTYILLTEVWDRWYEAIHDVSAFYEKSSKVLTPEATESRRQSLQSELVALRSSLKVSTQGYDQSEAGLVELIGQSGKAEGLRIETLTPTKLESGSGVALTVELLGSFHRIAAFLNHLENSPLGVKVETLEIIREKGRVLHVKMTLKATFISLSALK